MHKRFILLSLMLLLGLGLFAQTGLYFLSYDDTITEADSILTDQGFQVANDNTGNLIRYYPMNNPKIKVVSLIMNPDFKTVAGWQVVYNADNSEADDNYVFQQLTKMHNDWFKNYEETGQIVWFLTDTRTVHLVYLDDGSLTVLYYDSKFDKLFDIK
ncbi:MAG TPA: hypothetical protein PL124_04770 [Candidatus Cloacimonadota bacterium]|nr:hypothetical protein [Candidatus Cloacimonadota bacterium]HPS38707.1 hypothetical protein [Candidatus Cloacimonadota bacterium]